MGIRIKVDFPSDAELAKMFDAVPMLKKHDVMGAVTTAGAKVVEQRAKQLAPRGTESDRRKRGKTQKKDARWNIMLHTTIGMVTRKGNTRAFSVVGPKHPQGNKSHLNQPKRGWRRQVLWGMATRVSPYTVTRRWIVQAFDETRPAQLSAMKQTIKLKMDEMLT